jgi:hypothetical protein
MRKVAYKKWIPKEPDPLRFGGTMPGTGKMETDFTHKGTFHCWGFELDPEYKTSITVAFIEKEDGTMITLMPSDIKFLGEQDVKE